MIIKLKTQNSKLKAGFTLIELIVVIAIIAVLSGVILFGVTQYINKGKDSNISGNLAVLIPAGEVVYNANNNNSYGGFCESSVVEGAISQMPINFSGACYDGSVNPAGVCCSVAANGQSWAACATEFANPSNAYCVDSRGIRKEIPNQSCIDIAATSQCS